jgi:2-oxoglutarate dehydrogenase E1 component
MTISDNRKKHLLDRMYWTDEFSNFISTKFNTMKRFGLEGCESFIPGMKSAMDMCVEKGAEKAIIGMPHRGRLNILANVVRKPLSTIFAEFQGVMPESDPEHNWHKGSGDVKYHLGTSYTKEYPNGVDFTVEVLANPSHLECINPVVMGRTRAENHFRGMAQQGEKSRNKVVPFLVHGDAAFAGQGVCYEAIQMQDLKNY